MRTNIKIKKVGGKTNVKVRKVIDFKPLETVGRDDDEAWNAMKLYGESDASESKYVGQEPSELFKRLRRNSLGAKVLDLMNVA